MNALHNVLPPTLTAIVCASVFVLAGTMHARVPVEPASVSVRSNDLDFNRPQDAAILIDRIEEASIPACGGAPDYRDLHRISSFEQCRKAVIKRAVLQVGQPLVTKVAEIETLGMRLAVR
jgi:UrcA family protein